MHARTVGLVMTVLVGAPGCGDDTQCAGAECDTPNGGAGSSGGGGSGETTGGEGGGGGLGGSGGGGAAVTMETVYVTNTLGEPLADVLVFSSDDQGNVVEEAQTDASGSATIEIPSDGSVSAAYSLVANGELTKRVQTVVGFEESGQVTFQMDDGYVAPAQPTMKIGVTAYFGLPGTTGYRIQATCGEGKTISGTQVQTSLDGVTACDGNNNAVLVLAMAGTQPIGWAIRSNISFAPDSSQTVEFYQYNSNFDTSQVDYQNLPSSAQSAWAYIRQERGGVVWGSEEQKGENVVGASHLLSVNKLLPASTGPTNNLILSVILSDGPHGEEFTMRRHINGLSPMPATIQWNVGAQSRFSEFLPLDLSNSNHPYAFWGYDVTAPNHGVIAISASWVNAGEGTNTWDVYVPADRTDFIFPALPANEKDTYGLNLDSTIVSTEGCLHDFDGSAADFAEWVPAANEATYQVTCAYF